MTTVQVTSEGPSSQPPKSAAEPGTKAPSELAPTLVPRRLWAVTGPKGGLGTGHQARGQVGPTDPQLAREKLSRGIRTSVAVTRQMLSPFF